MTIRESPRTPGSAGHTSRGVVLCEANVVYRGRRQATAEASMTAAESGKLLAHGVATCMILELA